jgi:hypothetical protein
MNFFLLSVLSTLLLLLPLCEPAFSLPKLSHLVSRKAIPITGSARIPDQLSAEYDLVEGNSFFAVERACTGDSRNIEQGRGFKDRRGYYVQAIKDMSAIAHSAEKWPQYGTDASDLYFGHGSEEEKYSGNIVGTSAP